MGHQVGFAIRATLDDGRSNKDHFSVEIVLQLNAFRDHERSVRHAGGAGHPAGPGWQALAHHYASVPPHRRLAHFQQPVRATIGIVEVSMQQFNS
jgi:hypothetical protein